MPFRNEQSASSKKLSTDKVEVKMEVEPKKFEMDYRGMSGLTACRVISGHSEFH